ncbi:MAG TPA: DUF4276 family protein [Spirochaetota bacterium]|nr:DUF4276 family protein [Spirochaetota bacterium]HQO02650.1 DUF4276 family protein [Spirochaetota bacterium]HQP50275.1 DUF4276 family protein [Spirochaetota bacterium]
MSRIVFLLEERSMKALLDGLLPRAFPDMHFQCVPHEGKQDLEKSIPRKLRAWREPGVHFVVLRDNDSGDCIALKEHLVDLCREGRREDTLVRIVCQELEAWYFGEPAAIAKVYGNEKVQNIGRKTAFNNPDAIMKPSQKMRDLVPAFQKISGARQMAQVMSLEGNTSLSFQVFIEGLHRLLSLISDYPPQEK